MEENEISKIVLDAAIMVHRTLGGPGLLESVYQDALVYELKTRGLKVEKEVLVPVRYKDVEVGDPLRIDILVEGCVVVECKALATAKDPLFRAQCLTYLKMTGKRVGLVLNFGRPTLKEGIERVLNESKEEYRARLAREAPASFRNVLREEDHLTEEEILVCMQHKG